MLRSLVYKGVPAPKPLAFFRTNHANFVSHKVSLISIHFPPRIPTRTYATYRKFQGSTAQLVDLGSVVKNRYFAYFSAACVAFYVYNLDEAPFTHRYRFLWVPFWLERKIGDYSYSQIMRQYQHQLAPRQDPAYAQITRVMNKLLESAISNTSDPAQAAHLKSLNWDINIIRAPEQPPNAFILPNGKIFIFSLILPICQNEDGLATVLAHELSHQLAHHSLEQMGKQPIYVMLSTLLYAATGISGFNDLLIAGFLQMPASREMELEADRIGCELMARLCYNVHEAVKFWARMEAFEGKAAQRGAVFTEFLSTHPNTHKRVADISLWMPELESIREASDCYHWGMFQEVNRNFFGR